MPNTKPESPVVMEEVLLLCDYQVHFKDAYVCSLVPKGKDDKRRPINIPQNPGPSGISGEIIDYMLYEARVDPFQYPVLLARVNAKLKAQHDLQFGNS